MTEFGLRICSSIVLGILAVIVTWFGSAFYSIFWLVAALLVLAEWVKLSSWRLIWLVGGLLYTGIFFVAMLLLRNSPEGRTVILWLFGLIWATDSAAYFGGRAIGGPKLWPAVSPGKTWSGTIIGTIAGVLAGLVVLSVFGVQLHVMHAVLGLAIVIAAQLGDLLESAIKRHFGAKDSGRLIPGHGGVMDRCDSLIVAAAVALMIGALRIGAAPAQGLLLW